EGVERGGGAEDGAELRALAHLGGLESPPYVFLVIRIPDHVAQAELRVVFALEGEQLLRPRIGAVELLRRGVWLVREVVRPAAAQRGVDQLARPDRHARLRVLPH